MYQRLCNKFFLVVLLAAPAVNSAHASVPVFEISSATGTIVLISTQGASMEPHKGYVKRASSGKIAPASFESSIVTYDACVNVGTPPLGSSMRQATFSFLASPGGSYAVAPFVVPASRRANINGVSVVPNINSWVMTLVGMGLIAFQLGRKGRMRGAALRVG